MGRKKEKKAPVEEVKVFPPGFGPMVITGHTKELLGCDVGEGVTVESPAMFVNKEIMIEDMKKRAAVSDFAIYKKFIVDYPEEEMLLVYDEEFKYDSAYYLCLTIEAKDIIAQKFHLTTEVTAFPDEIAISQEIGVSVEKLEIVEDSTLQFYPFEATAMPWISLGSEKEVDDEIVQDLLPVFSVTFLPQFKYRPKAVELVDIFPSEFRNMCLDLPPYEEDQTFINRLTNDIGIQTNIQYKNSGTMTIRPKFTSSCNQYELVTFSSEKIDKILNSGSMKVFLRHVEKMMVDAILENEACDLFKDEFAALGESVVKSFLKENIPIEVYFTYTLGKGVVNKVISSVSVHSTIKGLFALSYVEPFSPEDYIDYLTDVVIDKHEVIVTSLSDMDFAKLTLKTYEEVSVLSFNPSSPYLIAAGTKNGLMFMWDLTVVKDYLRDQSKQNIVNRRDSLYTIEKFDDCTNLRETVAIRPAAVSAMEFRHVGGVVYFIWLPAHINVEAGGETNPSNLSESLQILSSGYDGVLRFWSLKKKFGAKYQESEYASSDYQRVMFTNIKSTYSVLDDVWKPFHALRLPKATSIHSYLLHFILKNASVDNRDDIENGETKLCSHIIGGTSDGNVVDLNWELQKNEAGNLDVAQPEYYTTVVGTSIHSGPVTHIIQSPFINDIFISIGFSSFGIWKKELYRGPLFFHFDKSKHFTAGAWSPSRPAVFVIASDDGLICSWDLLKGNPMEPVVIHKYPVVHDGRYISNIMYMNSLKGSQLQIYNGTFPLLPLLKVPEILINPVENELARVWEVVEHEIKRILFTIKFHDKLNAKIMAEHKLQAEKEKQEQEKPKKKESDIEVDLRTAEEKEKDFLRPLYDRYLELEEKFMKTVGLLVTEALPESPEQ